MADLRLIDGIGTWKECLTSAVPPNRPALILDRDGVIVQDTHYLGRADDVNMIAGAAAAIAWANRLTLPVVVVTNQAGIGRGLYNWQGFYSVQRRIAENLAASGAHLDLVLACAYHAEGHNVYQHPNHFWRKPNPGMILAAAEEYKIDLTGSLIVGDKLSDLIAGQRAGVGHGVLVATGHGTKEAITFDSNGLRPMMATKAPNIEAAIVAAREQGWLDGTF